jgi:hypothetical protein
MFTARYGLALLETGTTVVYSSRDLITTIVRKAVVECQMSAERKHFVLAQHRRIVQNN